MVLSVWLVLKILAAFLLGSIPFAKVAMLGTGVDITRVGSKNPGFNNVLRVSTKPRAAIALIGDIGKGLVALWLFSRGEAETARWLIGIAAVVGHCWSPLLGGNGGKGVATTLGVLLFLAPTGTLLGLPLYLAVRLTVKHLGWRQEGALASLVMMALISALVGGLAWVMFAIVVLRHLPNLRDISEKGIRA